MSEDSSKNWFQTLPGILTSLTAFVTAVAGLVAAINVWFPRDQGGHVVKPTDECIPGYVWREATPDDHVCVTKQIHDQTAEDNMLAGSRRNPNGGAYGADSCLEGFVWRDVFDGDHVCVTQQTRAQVLLDDRAGPDRIAH
jgi:hypothetical protein